MFEVTKLQHMKISFNYLFLLLLLILTQCPSLARASCEGIRPSLLLKGWYDPISHVLIKEEGGNSAKMNKRE